MPQPTTSASALAASLGVDLSAIDLQPTKLAIEIDQFVTSAGAAATAAPLDVASIGASIVSQVATSLGLDQSAITVTQAPVLLAPPPPPPTLPPLPPSPSPPPLAEKCGCDRYQNGVSTATSPDQLCMKSDMDNRGNTITVCTGLQIYYPVRGCNSDHNLCASIVNLSCEDVLNQRKCVKKKLKGKCHKRKMKRKCKKSCNLCARYGLS
jgi:hypothetical protein